MTALSPSTADLRLVVDDLIGRFAEIPDDAWGRPAAGLTWTCRETVAHILDDLVAYAMQISGEHGTGEGYVPLEESHQVRPDGPGFWLWPTPERGSAAIVTCLDAACGVFTAVLAVCPAGRRGWHPWGESDASGFAAMGLTETVLHADDVLRAVGVTYRPDAGVVGRVLDRSFPAAIRTEDAWQDLLAATGRTDATRGMPWRWDAALRG